MAPKGISPEPGEGLSPLECTIVASLARPGAFAQGPLRKSVAVCGRVWPASSALRARPPRGPRCEQGNRPLPALSADWEPLRRSLGQLARELRDGRARRAALRLKSLSRTRLDGASVFGTSRRMRAPARAGGPAGRVAYLADHADRAASPAGQLSPGHAAPLSPSASGAEGSQPSDLATARAGCTNTERVATGIRDPERGVRLAGPPGLDPFYRIGTGGAGPFFPGFSWGAQRPGRLTGRASPSQLLSAAAAASSACRSWLDGA